jgi:hypothetical protein
MKRTVKVNFILTFPTEGPPSPAVNG